MMSSLLIVLIKILANSAPQTVTVGDGLWCDYPSSEINLVLLEQQKVAITTGVNWPPLLITQSVNLTGGFDNCLLAKLNHHSQSFSHINGAQNSTGITIKTQTMSDIHLNHLIIENGKATNGAGIHASGRYSLKMNNLSVQNNLAEDSGGGLYLGGENNIVYLINSHIQSNSAKQGAGIAVEGKGNKITLNQGLLSNNKSTRFGGGFLCSGTHRIYLIEVKILNNSAPWGTDMFKTLNCQVNAYELDGQNDFSWRPLP